MKMLNLVLNLGTHLHGVANLQGCKGGLADKGLAYHFDLICVSINHSTCFRYVKGVMNLLPESLC